MKSLLKRVLVVTSVVLASFTAAAAQTNYSPQYVDDANLKTPGSVCLTERAVLINKTLTKVQTCESGVWVERNIGEGDMTKAVYDTNNDGKVNSAEVAEMLDVDDDGTPDSDWNGTTLTLPPTSATTFTGSLVGNAATATTATNATQLGGVAAQHYVNRLQDGFYRRGMVLDVDDAWGLPDDAALDFATYDGTNEVLHPDVYYEADGWNGYKFWMVATPYPNGDFHYENPSLWASNDGLTWEVPAGLTNPIDPYPGDPSFNSDPDFVVDSTGTMYVFYREVGNGNEHLRYRTSTDGVTWSDEGTALSVTAATENILSPAIVWDGSQWWMWTVDSVPATQTVRYRTSSSLTSGWSASAAATLTLPESNEPWHINAQNVGGRFYMMLNSQTGNTSIYLADSADGITWNVAKNPFLEGGYNVGTWDATLYRPAFVPCEYQGTTAFCTWYSVGGTNPGIGYTTIRFDENETDRVVYIDCSAGLQAATNYTDTSAGGTITYGGVYLGPASCWMQTNTTNGANASLEAFGGSTNMTEAVSYIRPDYLKDFRTSLRRIGTTASIIVIGGFATATDNNLKTKTNGHFFLCDDSRDPDGDGTASDAEDDNWWAVTMAGATDCAQLVDGDGDGSLDCDLDGTNDTAVVDTDGDGTIETGESAASIEATNTGVACTNTANFREFRIVQNRTASVTFGLEATDGFPLPPTVATHSHVVPGATDYIARYGITLANLIGANSQIYVRWVRFRSKEYRQ